MVAVSFHGHNFARLLVLAIGKQRTTVSSPNLCRKGDNFDEISDKQSFSKN